MDRAGLALLIGLALSGCGDTGSATDGGADRSVPDLSMVPPFCSDADPPDGGVPATFATVQRIFDDACVGCHSGDADLDLTRGRSYGNLIDQPAPAIESCGGTLVKPGSAAASYLWLKLSSPSPCKGMQMPIAPTAGGNFQSSPLPSCERDAVRRWIDDGARH